MPSRLRSSAGTLSLTATSQRLTNSDATEPTRWIAPGGHSTLDTAQVRFGRCEVVLAGEQQRHVDRDARKDRLLDRRGACAGARDLDEEIAALRLRVQSHRRLDRPGGIIRQQGRDLQRYPTVYALGGVVDRPEQVCRPRQVLQRELKE